MKKKVATKQVIPNAGFTVKGNIRSAVFQLDGWSRRRLSGGCFQYKALFDGVDVFIRFASGATQIHIFRRGQKVIACNGFLHIPPSDIVGVDTASKNKYKPTRAKA